MSINLCLARGVGGWDLGPRKERNRTKRVRSEIVFVVRLKLDLARVKCRDRETGGLIPPKN